MTRISQVAAQVVRAVVAAATSMLKFGTERLFLPQTFGERDHCLQSAIANLKSKMSLFA
jgi:hypothetical protein